MRRADFLVLAMLVSACGRSPPPEATAPPAAPPVAAAAASAATNVAGKPDNTNRLVQITRFDCVKAEERDDPNAFPWAQGLSRWAAGGPGGATWNAGNLDCAVEFQTRCTQGVADVELRIGAGLAGTRQAKIEHAGLTQVLVILSADQWRKRFDQSSPLTKRFSYRTATFSAAVIASCEAPETLGPSNGPRLEFSDDRHFSAGFASGE
jgi:hypothetical protein